MDQAHVGLAIQLVGTALAGWALVGELRSKPEEGQEPKAKPKRARRDPENPWMKPWTTKVPRVTQYDREAYERKDMDTRPRNRGTHPDTLALAEWIGGVMREYLDRAAADWKRQLELARELREADEQLRAEQAERVAQQHAATRRRVIIEMVGLVIVAIGTIVGTAP